MTVRTGTYSIVARDRDTGELGVAVQSHWFSVGSIVSWARPGVGAVATQSIAEPAYGPHLLERLATGELPDRALADELARDDAARFRQVAVVDGPGRVAVHTGDGCIAAAGHSEGDGFCVQANMMSGPEVWPAMARAFEAASGPLERRLLAALEAGEAAGGDVRGRQSAALAVVAAEGEPWARKVELRVEDAPDPARRAGAAAGSARRLRARRPRRRPRRRGRSRGRCDALHPGGCGGPGQPGARILGRARARRRRRRRRRRQTGGGGDRGR